MKRYWTESCTDGRVRSDYRRMLDFNIDDFSVEELREKFEALKTTGSEPAANAGNSESFALEGQFRDELFGALESEKVENLHGNGFPLLVLGLRQRCV